MNKRTLAVKFLETGIHPTNDQQSTQNPVTYTQKPGQTEFIDIATSFSNSDNSKDLGSIPRISTPDNGNSEGWKSTSDDLKSDCLCDKPKEMSNTRLIVPVVPNEKLECLLIASIELCKKARAEDIGVCKYLFRALERDFAEVLTDEGWKPSTNNSIKSNCEKLIELCILKSHEDWFCLLDSLALVFDPNNKFNTVNIAKSSKLNSNIPEEELYARSYDPAAPRGWLVDLINRFGTLGGFNILLERFQSNRTNLTIPVIHALIRPFGLCVKFLTAHTLVYFVPILETIVDILNNLVDEELKTGTTSDEIFAILAVSKILITPILDQSEPMTELNTLKMKMILRILQISSYNGKLSAMIEINEIIDTIESSRKTSKEKPDCVTVEYITQWIKENGVLEIVLKDYLDQAEYVGQLGTILEFMIVESVFTLEDLDRVWAAQAVENQEAVKNVHDLLIELAQDISIEQLDHLFECFETSFKTSDDGHRGKLLELMRRLTEDDKDGEISHKVLTYLWDCVHWNVKLSTQIINQALKINVGILKDRTYEIRALWLDKFVEELKTHEQWVLPAIKHIRGICTIFEQNPNVGDNKIENHTIFSKMEVIRSVGDSTFVLVVTNLVGYMGKMRKVKKKTPTFDPDLHRLHKQYSHTTQVQERLNYIKFLLEMGNFIMSVKSAKSIWECLVEHPVHNSDPDNCFLLFSKLMKNRKIENFQQFFKDKVLKLDPVRLTGNGFDCYESLFKAVNSESNGKVLKIENQVNLVGIDYLWKLVYKSRKEVVNRGLKLMEQIYVKRKLQNTP